MKIRSFHVKQMAKFEEMVPVHRLKSKVEKRFSQIRCENKAHHDNIQLENVFMKHYAPNHMPDPKGEWTLKENNSELHHGIYSKVNQFTYILVCNYMPNIRIQAKAVLQIFHPQSCSYTKCLCPENGSNSTENLWNVLKSLSVHLHLGL